MNAPNAALYRPSDRDLVKGALRSMGARLLVDVLFGGVAGVGELTITESFGTRTRSVHGQRVRAGDGLGGQAMHRARPVGVRDYFASSDITHLFDHVVRVEGMQSMVAIPVLVDGSARAVLYAATRARYHLGDAIVREFVDSARAIGQEIRIRDEVDRRIAIMRVAEAVEAGDRDLREAVRVAHAELLSIASTTDDSELANRIMQLVRTLEARPAPGSRVPRLSRRELDVLSQVALGCDYAQVGRRLSLQVVTVKSYMRSVMGKLGCHNRVEAVAVARRLRLLP